MQSKDRGRFDLPHIATYGKSSLVWGRVEEGGLLQPPKRSIVRTRDHFAAGPCDQGRHDLEFDGLTQERNVPIAKEGVRTAGVETVDFVDVGTIDRTIVLLRPAIAAHAVEVDRGEAGVTGPAGGLVGGADVPTSPPELRPAGVLDEEYGVGQTIDDVRRPLRFAFHDAEAIAGPRIQFSGGDQPVIDIDLGRIIAGSVFLVVSYLSCRL
jgi:hypothetical protein